MNSNNDRPILEIIKAVIAEEKARRAPRQTKLDEFGFQTEFSKREVFFAQMVKR